MTDEEKEMLEEWKFILSDISHYVQIGKEKGIKFEIRTNEKGSHNRPHLHVSTGSASMSIAIDDVEILACTGKISPAQKKYAVEWTKQNKDRAIEMWNKYSNGRPIEI